MPNTLSPADIEYTDRHNQFYEKFSSRQCISDILESLWNIPSHLAVARQYAAQDGGRGGCAACSVAV